MQTDAEVALSLAPAGSALQATAHLLLGTAQLLAGETDPAGQRLADAADIGEELGITRQAVYNRLHHLEQRAETDPDSTIPDLRVEEPEEIPHLESSSPPA